MKNRFDTDVASKQNMVLNRQDFSENKEILRDNYLKISLIVHIVECGRQASWVRDHAKKTWKRSTNKFPLNKLLSFRAKVLSVMKEN